MEVGVTVGDSVERLEATAGDFAFAELSIGESAYVPAEETNSHLRTALDTVDTELCVHLPFEQVVSTRVHQLNDAIVAHLTELLDWAGTLGAQKAVLHGTMRNPHDVEQRQVFADQLSAIASAGDDAGVALVVENVGHQARGLPLSVLGDIARETETAVCFDVGHAYMEDGNDGIERFLGEYADLVSHLHVHDARGRGDTHLPIGAGEIEYELVAEPLSDFDGTVAVEVFTDDVPLLRDSAERARRHLQQGLGSSVAKE
ncbi:sugar phosphate isomerase/epimerase family protein [Haloarcula nitratireducens]|uniref:Sugar phosphate isomerase/epimerase n=1 Tax=Haloarcula nitratireducens TaxID=2487749 RepID=A0AAW4PGP0_9EURY|nr:sugar phosphate isomerase/epimerase [Halomicroarcula nitratireducens]MBX0296696.1 sugar phosphate isomerase/epimerase [Halomicroarcula nitratireducens]